MKINFSLLLYCLLFKFSFSQQHIIPVSPDAVKVIAANDADLTTGLKPARFQNLDEDPKVFAIQGWTNENQSFSWTVQAAKTGEYKVAILVRIKGLSDKVPATLQLLSTGRKIILQSGNTGWDKIFFPDPLRLDAGTNQLQLQLINIPPGEHPDISVYSLEIGTERAWEKNNATANELRSKPEWLTNADYGLFFHWNARSKPRTGPAKSYVDAVQDFDVTKFAATVRETGADFIVLTTSWALSTFPAPLKSLDNLLPGNTTPRDLIADLSDALAKWNIKLLVYCNFRLNRIGWKKEDRFVPQKMDSFFNKLISIYQEIAERYAKKIGGLWIDDGMGLYAYNTPFETLAKIIKHKNKNMVVSYNSWIYPRFTDFQDFYGGEHGITHEAAGIKNIHLSVGGDGYFKSGPQQGLKATFCGLLEPGDWTHTELNQDIPPPLLKTDEL